MSSLATFFFGFLASINLWASEIEMAVTLTPAGSFVAKADKVKVEGWTKTADGFSANSIAVDLSTTKTGIGMRDGHMKDKYLEIAKFPLATMTDVIGKGSSFKGNLDLHGVKKPVSGNFEFSEDKVVAKFKVKSSDFQIAQASYKGVGVEDEVEVTAKIDAKTDATAVVKTEPKIKTKNTK